MSTIKISQLTPVTPPVLAGSLVPVVQNGVTVKTTVAQLRPTVSVTDYGAKGDDSTSNTAAIQAAIDALTAGGTLYFPPGTYVCGALTIGNADVTFDMSAGAVLKFSTLGAGVAAITVNAKCQRMGVCNAAESLLVHRDIAAAFLPDMAATLTAQGVEIVADDATRALVPAAGLATEADYATEFLGPKISIAVVGETTPSMAEARSGSSKRYGPSFQEMSTSSGSRVRREGTMAMSSKP